MIVDVMKTAERADIVSKVASLAALVLAIALFLFVGRVIGKNETRIEAVKSGHAKWVADEDGNTTFEWLRDTPCKIQAEERKEKK